MNGRGVQAARDCYTANVRYWPKADTPGGVRALPEKGSDGSHESVTQQGFQLFFLAGIPTGNPIKWTFDLERRGPG